MKYIAVLAAAHASTIAIRIPRRGTGCLDGAVKGGFAKVTIGASEGQAHDSQIGNQQRVLQLRPRDAGNAWILNSHANLQFPNRRPIGKILALSYCLERYAATCGCYSETA